MGIVSTKSTNTFGTDEDWNYCEDLPMTCTIATIGLLALFIITTGTISCYCFRKRRRENSQSMVENFQTSNTQELDNLKRDKEALQQNINVLQLELNTEKAVAEKDHETLQQDINVLQLELNAAKAVAEDERKRANQLLDMRIAQNPDMQNLNDPNRPEKIVRNFKNLANNLRLDMMEALGSEDESLEALMMPAVIAMKCYERAQVYLEECQAKVRMVVDQAAVGKMEAPDTAKIGGGVDGERLEQLKQATQLEIKQELKLRSTEEAVAETVKQVLGHFDLSSKPDAVKFVKECARLTWYMVLQAVPLKLLEAHTGQPLDHNCFTLFAECASGGDKHVTCTVWPAIVSDAGLTEGFKGSSQHTVLEKGVAFTTQKY